MFLNEGRDKPHNGIVERNQQGARLPSTDPEMLQSHLEGPDAFKLAGLDKLHPRVLKALADIIAQPLARIFEHSWCTDQVPKDWKRASVVPIFKKGWREELGNYRPVSLPSILGKTLGKKY